MDKQVAATEKQQPRDGDRDGETAKCCCLYKVLLIDQDCPKIDIEGKSQRSIGLAIEHNVDLIEESFIYADDEPIDEIFRDAYHFVDDAKIILKNSSKRRLYNEAGLDGLRIKHDCDYAEDIIDYIKVRVSLLFQKRSRAEEEQKNAQVDLGHTKTNKGATSQVDNGAEVVHEAAERTSVSAMPNKPIVHGALKISSSQIVPTEGSQRRIMEEAKNLGPDESAQVLERGRDEKLSESSIGLESQAVIEAPGSSGSRAPIEPSPPKVEDWPSSCDSTQAMICIEKPEHAKETAVRHDVVSSQNEAQQQLLNADHYKTSPAPPPPTPTMDTESNLKHQSASVETQMRKCSEILSTVHQKWQQSSESDVNTQQRASSLSCPLKSADPGTNHAVIVDRVNSDHNSQLEEEVEEKNRDNIKRGTNKVLEADIDETLTEKDSDPAPTASLHSEIDHEGDPADNRMQESTAINMSASNDIDLMEDDIKRAISQSVQIPTGSLVCTGSQNALDGVVGSEKAPLNAPESTYEVLTVSSDTTSDENDEDNCGGNEAILKNRGNKEDRGAGQCSSSRIQTIRHRR